MVDAAPLAVKIVAKWGAAMPIEKAPMMTEKMTVNISPTVFSPLKSRVEPYLEAKYNFHFPCCKTRQNRSLTELISCKFAHMVTVELFIHRASRVYMLTRRLKHRFHT